MFGAVKLTTNPKTDKYSYFRYVIGFDYCSLFSLSNSWGKNIVIFGVENGSSAHIDNKKKDIVVLGKVQHKD